MITAIIKTSTIKIKVLSEILPNINQYPIKVFLNVHIKWIKIVKRLLYK
jgi:hypothetical protein